MNSGSGRERADREAGRDESYRGDGDGRSDRGASVSTPDWSALVRKIQNGDPSGMEELYRTFARGVRFFLCRHLGPQELDDKVHDTFLIVLQAIQRGDLREPERLMGFVRTVVRRQVANHIDEAVQARKDHTDLETGAFVSDSRRNPEESVFAQEKEEIMVKVLKEISRRDREILTRFYLLEQPQEQICSEMNLTVTQFRLLKSRAKVRFGELGKRRIAKGSISALIMRAAAGLRH